MSVDVWFGASIVCLRFLAERFCADGRGFSHRSSEASGRETLTGSSPVCMIRGKNEGQCPGPEMSLNCGNRTGLVNRVALNLGWDTLRTALRELRQPVDWAVRG
jgi:hypothetical protein